MEKYINKVIQSDPLEMMKTFPNKCIDLILTDPPYRDEEDNRPTESMKKYGGLQNFGGKLSIEQFDEFVRISKNQIIWGANNFDCLPPYKGFISWQKTNIPENFTMSMVEIAYLSENLGTISKAVHFDSNEKPRFHPTQKPLALMKWCLNNYSKEGDLILDPFLGSGTTAVACKEMNRRFIGIEKNSNFCEIARHRLEQTSVNLFANL